MGRQGSRLLDFLRNAIEKKKYQNLIVDSSGLTFSIILPHKTKRLSEDDEQIFKDWYELNTKDYVFGSSHYTMAKQALTASLKKSDYVEKVPSSRSKLTYRILEDHEIKEKKRIRKDLKKNENVKIEASCSDDPVSPVESGYGSAVDSPPSRNFADPTKDNLLTLDVSELLKVVDYLEANRNVELNEALSSVKLEYSCGVNSLPTVKSVESSNDYFITSSKTGLLQDCHMMPSNNLVLNNDIPQAEFSSLSAFDGFVDEIMDDCISTENSVKLSKDIFITSSKNGLLQDCHMTQASNLFLNNDIQQAASFSPCALDGFVNEAMDDCISTENSVKLSKDIFITSSKNGLLQDCHMTQASNLFLNNDIQQVASSSPCALDGFVDEAMDDCISTENSVKLSNDNFITSIKNGLLQDCHMTQASNLFLNNDIQQAASSSPCALDGFVNEAMDDCISTENSVKLSKDIFITSSKNGLLQDCHMTQASNLFLNNDIQQAASSSPCVLDRFVDEAMDDSVPTEKFVSVLDATELFEDSSNNNQSFTDKLESTNYLHKNTKYPTHGLNSMEYSSENTELSCSSFIENYPAENEVRKIWDLLQTSDISDEKINNFIITGIPALNSESSMTNDENLDNNASEMQNMYEQHNECQELLNKALTNKQMEDVPNINSQPSMSFEENIPKQISSSQGRITTAFEEAILKETTGFKTVKDNSLAIDHLAIFSKSNVQ